MTNSKILSLAGYSFILVLFLSACASLNKAVKARELLGKCEYELKEVKLKTIDFAPIITFNTSSKKVNLEAPNTADLILLADKIQEGEFDLNFSKLTFDAYVEIQNPNEQEVIADSMFFDCFFDETYLMQIGHFEHTTVPAKSAGITVMTLSVPTNLQFNSIMGSEYAKVDGKIWLRLTLLDGLNVRLPVPVKLKRPIPYDEINAAIEKQKQKIIKELMEKAKKEEPVKQIKKLLNF